MRLHFYVSRRLSQRVERVGTMLGHAKARAAAFLLDNASQVDAYALTSLNRPPAAAPNSTPAEASSPADNDDGGDDVVLMYVRLDPDVAARIGQLAKKQGLSLSRVCARLLSRAVEDERWIVDTVQARLRQALATPDNAENGQRAATEAPAALGNATGKRS